MRNLLLLFTLLLSIQVAAQKRVNYLKVRDELRPPLCGFRDSLSTTEVYSSLLAFDTNTVRKNIAQYYHDLAEMEYLLFMYTGNSKFLEKHIKNNLRELHHDPKSPSVWNVAFGFHLFGECEKVEKYLAIYKKYHSKLYKKETEQIKLLRKTCVENHERIYGKTTKAVD